MTVNRGKYINRVVSYCKYCYLRTSVLLGSLDEVEEYNEVYPPSAVHCLSGRNYAVYPLACGEWRYHCAFPSIQGAAWAYRGAVGNHFLSSLFRLFFPSVASGCRDGFPCFVVCTEHSCHGMHQVCKASWRHLFARSPFLSLNPIDYGDSVVGLRQPH